MLAVEEKNISYEYTHQTSLAKLDGEIVAPEIAVKFVIWDALKVHCAQT